MAIELKIPSVGESVTEVMVGEWLVETGASVEEDDPLVVIETDKVSVEVPAPSDGKVVEILKKEGEDATVGDVVGMFEPSDGSSSGASSDEVSEDEPADEASENEASEDDASEDEPSSPDDEASRDESAGDEAEEASAAPESSPKIMPAARRLLDEHGVKAADVEPSGPGGRLLKEDVLRHIDAIGDVDGEQTAEREDGSAPDRAAEDTARASKAAGKPAAAKKAAAGSESVSQSESASQSRQAPAGAREEEAVKMTPLRRRVASRLVEAQQNAALLTTFNEIDMSAVMGLRKRYQEQFVGKYEIKLGFMSFFVKAVVEALKDVPQVNAEIRDDHVVYRNYQDIGVAVGGGKGLVVPVIRNAERLSFAEVEQTIADLAGRAQKGKLKLEELQGGTFTISNGGIYGSLLSTPIVNPPQSGILGMHKIEERPVVVDGEIVVRPMMYVALTYDHRIIDGREAVTFLVRVKERIEDPTRILLEV